MRVVVDDIQSRPELNGRKGRLVTCSDEAPRCGVLLDGEQTPISLKKISRKALVNLERGAVSEGDPTRDDSGSGAVSTRPCGGYGTVIIASFGGIMMMKRSDTVRDDVRCNCRNASTQQFRELRLFCSVKLTRCLGTPWCMHMGVIA